MKDNVPHCLLNGDGASGIYVDSWCASGAPSQATSARAKFSAPTLGQISMVQTRDELSRDSWASTLALAAIVLGFVRQPQN
jgi:hypothetical protein